MNLSSVVEDFYASYTHLLDSLALQAGQQIVVALGGGADSQSVLDLTLRFREDHPQYRFLAIHLDHFFHPDSPEWAEFLRHECERVSIDAIVEPLKVPQGARQSKEEQGRLARYQRMAELTEPDAVILLGQHRTDQVETFLLQMRRGAGPKGLAAMASVSELRTRLPQASSACERRLVRPLLAHTKAEIYHYANARGLRWIEDETNTDTQIDRNFMRHEILPVLEKRWPTVQSTIARSAALCAEQDALLERLLRPFLEQRVLPEGFYLGTDWWDVEPMLQRALLRGWFEIQGVQLPSHRILLELQQQVQRSKGGRRVRIRWGAVEVIRQQKWLRMLPLSNE